MSSGGPSQEQPQVGQESQCFKSNTLYLQYGQIDYVPDVRGGYFNIGAAGVEPFRFYKPKIQQFLGALDQTLEQFQDDVAKAVSQGTEGQSPGLEDKTYHERMLSEGTDTKNQLKFRVMLVASGYNNLPFINLRNYVFLEDKKVWWPTKRGVRLALGRDEFNLMREFINCKLKPARPPKPSPISATNPSLLLSETSSIKEEDGASSKTD